METANLQAGFLSSLRLALPMDGYMLAHLNLDLKVHDESLRPDLLDNGSKQFTVSVHYRHHKM